MERLEKDFYAVEDAPKGKRIHVYGYCYQSECPQADEKGYRHLEFCFFYLPIGFTQSLYDSECDKCKQYATGYDGDGIIEVMDSYQAVPMRMVDVTHSTPCGMYIDC